MSKLEHYYKILELEPDASLEEIRQAYKDLATMWHPDRAPQNNPRLQKKAQNKLQEINEAYEYLKGYRGGFQSQPPSSRSKPPQPASPAPPSKPQPPTSKPQSTQPPPHPSPKSQSPTPSKSNRTTRSPKTTKIPYRWLALILVSYTVLGWAAALVAAKAGVGVGVVIAAAITTSALMGSGALVGVHGMAGALIAAGTGAGVVIGALVGAGAGPGAVIGALVAAGTEAGNKLITPFGRFKTFLILSGTSGLGLSLGGWSYHLRSLL